MHRTVFRSFFSKKVGENPVMQVHNMMINALKIMMFDGSHQDLKYTNYL